MTNIRGTENVLEAAHVSNTPVFLTSSSEVYGKNISDSLKESDDRILGSPVTLRWSYSEAKAIDESLAYAYYIEKQLETRTVRFFNTVGPRQLGAYGMVVPRFIKAALANEPITIYGDGKQSRSFCYIDDLIAAFVKYINLAEDLPGPINLGNPQEFTMLELASIIVELTQSKSILIHSNLPQDDPRQRRPDISRAIEELKWTPNIPLREGLKSMLDNY
jgi:UDP-glucose 4-epimerase